MKKYLLVAFLFLSVLSAKTYAQDKKVAVVTFYINRQIDVTEFGAMAYLTVEQLADNPDFNLSPMLKTYHQNFFDVYSKDFPFQLLPEDQVTGNPDYKTFNPRGTDTTGLFKATRYLTPYDGYKIVMRFAGSANEKNLLKVFNQCDGIMDISVDFKLIKIGFGGMGVVKVLAKTNIVLYNQAGEKVFDISEEARSKNMSPLVAGVPVMSPEKILPLCQSAMDNLMEELEKDLPKMGKKSQAKL